MKQVVCLPAMLQDYSFCSKVTALDAYTICIFNIEIPCCVCPQRPYFTVVQPDQSLAVGRPAEKDFLEQHVRRQRPKLSDRLSGCFCGAKAHSRGRQQQRDQVEEWRRFQPQLVQ